LLPSVGLVVISLLLAMASYKFVELPFWKGRYSGANPRRSLLVAILLILVGVAGFFHLLRSAPDIKGLADPYLRLNSDTPDIYNMPCDGWYHHARVDPCTFGVSGADKTVVMLGDSIGVQWFSSVPEIFPEPEWLTVVLTKSSCPFVDEDIFYRRIGKIYDVCREWREAVLALLVENKPDVIVVGSAASYDFNAAQWVEGSARVFERLSAVAKLVIVIPGTPSLGFDGPGCIARHTKSSELDGRPMEACTSIAPPPTVTEYLSQVADRFPNVHVVDLNDLVCPKGLCRAVNPSGVVVFRDSQHLSDSFVRSVTPEIRHRIKALDSKL
ncbi:MAG: SGNH hydrolase domain-containing protein, partial [Spongiibacteraceae bacterium]